MQSILRDNPHLYRRDIQRLVADGVRRNRGGAGTREDRVELRGFGAFVVKQRRARLGRNPRTGEAVAVPEKGAPFFKPGKQLRERINDRA